MITTTQRMAGPDPEIADPELEKEASICSAVEQGQQRLYSSFCLGIFQMTLEERLR
jgi:hypothetical protein